MIHIQNPHLEEIMQELFGTTIKSHDDLTKRMILLLQRLEVYSTTIAQAIDRLSLEVHSSLTTYFDDLLQLQLSDQRSVLEVLIAAGYLPKFVQQYTPNGPIVYHDVTIMAYDETQTIKERVFIETAYTTTDSPYSDLVEIYIERPREYQKEGTVPILYIANPYVMGTNNDAFAPEALHSITETHEDPIQSYQLTDYSKPGQTRLLPELTASLEEIVEPPLYGRNPAMKRYLAKGYAVIYYAGRGAYYSQGYNLTGSIEELDAVDATLRWIDGDTAGYYDLEATQRVVPTWSNGTVAMTGKSYLGTLAIGTATYSKSRSLKTILPEAGISNWYDYYRYNNLVVAPQGYPGEDIDILSWFCESFLMNPTNATQAKRQRFRELFEAMRHDMDRESGYYNEFWDQRNYLNQADQIQVPMLIMHGTNDWNVKISHLFKLMEATQNNSISRNFVIHRGKHISIHSIDNYDLMDLMDRWLDYYLLDLGAQPLTNGQGIVQSNLNPNQWDQVNYDQRQQIRFKIEGDRLIQSDISTNDSVEATINTFETQLDFLSAKDWQEQLLDPQGTLAISYESDSLENQLHLHGTMRIQLKVKSNRNEGALSCLLVDYGSHRIVNERTQSTSTKRSIGLSTKLPQTTFTYELDASDSHIITRGWVNLKTPVNSSDDQGFQTYEIDMIPMDYTLPEGHRLGLIIYGNDYLYTLHPTECQKYQVLTESIQLVIDFL